jgi:hypothetical protein
LRYLLVPLTRIRVLRGKRDGNFVGENKKERYRKMRKSSLILACLLILAIVPSVFADSGHDYNYYYYYGGDGGTGGAGGSVGDVSATVTNSGNSFNLNANSQHQSQSQQEQQQQSMVGSNNSTLKVINQRLFTNPVLPQAQLPAAASGELKVVGEDVIGVTFAPTGRNNPDGTPEYVKVMFWNPKVETVKDLDKDKWSPMWPMHIQRADIQKMIGEKYGELATKYQAKDGTNRVVVYVELHPGYAGYGASPQVGGSGNPIANAAGSLGAFVSVSGANVIENATLVYKLLK